MFWLHHWNHLSYWLTWEISTIPIDSQYYLKTTWLFNFNDKKTIRSFRVYFWFRFNWSNTKQNQGCNLWGIFWSSFKSWVPCKFLRNDRSYQHSTSRLFNSCFSDNASKSIEHNPINTICSWCISRPTARIHQSVYLPLHHYTRDLTYCLQWPNQSGTKEARLRNQNDKRS